MVRVVPQEFHMSRDAFIAVQTNTHVCFSINEKRITCPDCWCIYLCNCLIFGPRFGTCKPLSWSDVGICILPKPLKLILLIFLEAKQGPDCPFLFVCILPEHKHIHLYSNLSSEAPFALIYIPMIFPGSHHFGGTGVFCFKNKRLSLLNLGPSFFVRSWTCLSARWPIFCGILVLQSWICAFSGCLWGTTSINLMSRVHF